jgi:hypothetical protein
MAGKEFRRALRKSVPQITLGSLDREHDPRRMSGSGTIDAQRDQVRQTYEQHQRDEPRDSPHDPASADKFPWRPVSCLGTPLQSGCPAAERLRLTRSLLDARGLT